MNLQRQLELMFGGVEVHDPIENISGYGDEGAANHLVSAQHLKPGFQIFVYGSSAFEAHQGIIARQAEEISLRFQSNISLILIE